MAHSFVAALFLVMLSVLSQVVLSQIPTACADGHSLEEMMCCPLTANGVCGEDTGRGVCTAVNFPRHSNRTTNVRVNWPHYYTHVCECSGNYGGYDCSRCKYGYFGQDCVSRAILPRKPIRDFTDEEWEDFIHILRQTKTYDSGYKVALEEQLPGVAALEMANVSLFDLMIWMHHYAAKDAFEIFSPDYLDYAHGGPAFFMWHRWYHVFFESEIQAMLQAMGRTDYYKFRFPYWDWRGEIQRSYGLPSEQLFSINRLGETRNVSNRPIVYGNLVADDWNTYCLDTPVEICDPNVVTDFLQRCPFTSDPNLCHSSNPDWPSMQEVNDLLELEYYEEPSNNFLGSVSLRGIADFFPASSIEACREDSYCICLPVGGVQCDVDNNSSDIITITVGVHSKVHYLPGLGGAQVLPAELRGSIYDIAGSPNDPLFILHHLMVDCIFEEWKKLHPISGYPDDPMIRDGHRKDDYIRTFYPLITNGEAFASAERFGYYCELPNLGVTEPTAPSPLETVLQFIISGSSVDVCVETKEAVFIKLVLRDTNNNRHVVEFDGASGCGTFNDLPAGRHRVRAISREKLPGSRGKRYTSKFYYFSTNI